MKRILKPLLLGLITAAAGTAAADRITFYTDDNFGGRAILRRPADLELRPRLASTTA